MQLQREEKKRTELEESRHDTENAVKYRAEGEGEERLSGRRSFACLDGTVTFDPPSCPPGLRASLAPAADAWRVLADGEHRLLVLIHASPTRDHDADQRPPLARQHRNAASLLLFPPTPARQKSFHLDHKS